MKMNNCFQDRVTEDMGGTLQQVSVKYKLLQSLGEHLNAAQRTWLFGLIQLAYLRWWRGAPF